MKFSAIAASAGTLVTVAVFDYWTGYELLCHVFYFIPVAIVAWYAGRTPAWGMSVVAAVVWVAIDFYGGHVYSHAYLRYWNAGMFFSSFAVVGYLIDRLRRTLDSAKQLAEEKAAALQALEESTLRLRRLEGSFQTMCAWTNQIKDGHEWVSFQEFLHRRLHIRLTHGISPQGVRVMESRKGESPPAIEAN